MGALSNDKINAILQVSSCVVELSNSNKIQLHVLQLHDLINL